MTWNDIITALSAGSGSAAGASPARRVPINPRPPGQLVPGSTPDAVLGWLRDRAGMPCTLQRITRGVSRPEKTVSWALIVLRRRGLVERRLVEPGRAVWWSCGPASEPHEVLRSPEGLAASGQPIGSIR